MVAPNGHLVCATCGIGLRNTANARSVFKQQAAAARFDYLVGINVRDEVKKNRRSDRSPEHRRLRKACTAWVKKIFKDQPDGNSWTSHATGITHDLASTAPSKQPDDPSPDALFPARPFEGSFHLHIPNNMWMIEQCLNYLKHIQLPGVLEIIGYNLRFWHKFETGQTSPTPAEIEAHIKFIRKTITVAARIRVKAGYTVFARTKKPYVPAVQESDEQEWLSLKERKNEAGPWRYRSVDLRVGILYQSGTWHGAVLHKLHQAAEYWQQQFNVTLEEKNGIFFMCDVPMPDFWGPTVAYRLFNTRQERMRDFCNVSCITIDTPETIYILCIIIACIVKCVPIKGDKNYDHWTMLKERFGDALKLPVGIEIHEAIRFAIGHLIHHIQMVGGVDLIDWKIWLWEVCNIMRETCTSNYLKHDYTEAQVKQALEITRHIRIKNKEGVYDSTIVPSAARLGHNEITLLKVDETVDAQGADVLPETVIGAVGPITARVDDDDWITDDEDGDEDEEYYEGAEGFDEYAEQVL